MDNKLEQLLKTFNCQDGVWTEAAVIALASQVASQVAERCAEMADECVQKRLDYPGDRIRAQFGLIGR